MDSTIDIFPGVDPTVRDELASTFRCGLILRSTGAYTREPLNISRTDATAASRDVMRGRRQRKRRKREWLIQ